MEGASNEKDINFDLVDNLESSGFYSRSNSLPNCSCEEISEGTTRRRRTSSASNVPRNVSDWQRGSQSEEEHDIEGVLKSFDPDLSGETEGRGYQLDLLQKSESENRRLQTENQSLRDELQSRPTKVEVEEMCKELLAKNKQTEPPDALLQRQVACMSAEIARLKEHQKYELQSRPTKLEVEEMCRQLLAASKETETPDALLQRQAAATSAEVTELKKKVKCHERLMATHNYNVGRDLKGIKDGLRVTRLVCNTREKQTHVMMQVRDDNHEWDCRELNGSLENINERLTQGFTDIKKDIKNCDDRLICIENVQKSFMEPPITDTVTGTASAQGPNNGPNSDMPGNI